MAQKQAAPEGSRKPNLSDITKAVEMGANARHFEVWHNRQSVNAITAIWRNEVGPAQSASFNKVPQ